MTQKNVESISNPNPLSVAPGTKAAAAMKLLANSNINIAPVLENGRLIGIVKYDDLKNASADASVESAMSDPLYVEKGKSIDYAIKYVVRHKINMVPVVESSIGMKCIGIITASNLLRVKRSMR
ncbi:MAG: CBS domain-containing protein [Candidatus Micrarchaeaceae archaeon]